MARPAGALMETVIYILIGLHGVMVLNIALNRASFTLRRRARSSNALPSVSVLVPARDEEHNLPRLLASFKQQDHPKAEMIVYDDQSSDGTWHILENVDDERIRGIRGQELPDGWVGKTNGCYQLSLQASGQVFLFIDADTEFQHPSALRHMCERFAARPPSTILTGMTLLEGGGRSIVSMVGAIIVSCIPWWMGRYVPASAMSGVNGQCWMITKADYRQYEPHQYARGEVLEDIRIGRYLHQQGLIPLLDDVTNDLTVHMYGSFPEAWAGFRKNTADILGRSTATSLLGLTFYVFMFIAAPFIYPPLVVSLLLMKFASDRVTRQPLRVTLLAPVSFLLVVGLGVDSIWTRSRGRIQWKGRVIRSSA
jgi:glycosyltransferase involved in cell wall biosynthesis